LCANFTRISHLCLFSSSVVKSSSSFPPIIRLQIVHIYTFFRITFMIEFKTPKLTIRASYGATWSQTLLNLQQLCTSSESQCNLNSQSFKFIPCPTAAQPPESKMSMLTAVSRCLRSSFGGLLTLVSGF
jgi:hypothetical protein